MAISATIESDIITALNYLGKVNINEALAAIKKPTLAGIVKAAGDADSIAKVIGIFVPPVAIAANDAAAIISGVQFLMSISSAQIPQTTLDTENYIEDRFQNPGY